MKKLIILVVILSALAALYFFWKQNLGKGSSETANSYAKSFIENYVDMTYGTNADNLTWQLDKWRYEKKHYRLEISAEWKGTFSSVFYSSTCQVKQSLLVIIDKNGDVYDYSITNKNPCALEQEVAGVAAKTTEQLFELSKRIRNNFKKP